MWGSASSSGDAAIATTDDHEAHAPNPVDMTLNPRDWPVWLSLFVVVVVSGLGYLLQQQLTDGWDTAINLVGGAIVLIVGVSMADRLMSRRDGRWGSG